MDYSETVSLPFSLPPANWNIRFDPKLTVMSKFVGSKVSNLQVPMMTAKNVQVPYFRDKVLGTTVMQVQYSGNSILALFIFPDSDRMAKVEAALFPSTLQRWREKLKMRYSHPISAGPLPGSSPLCAPLPQYPTNVNLYWYLQVGAQLRIPGSGHLCSSRGAKEDGGSTSVERNLLWGAVRTPKQPSTHLPFPTQSQESGTGGKGDDQRRLGETVWGYYCLSQDIVTHLFTHLLIHSLTHLLAHAFTQSLIYSLTHSFAHSISHSITYSLTQSLTHFLTHSVIHPLFYSLNSFIHSQSFTDSLIHIFIHLVSNLLTHRIQPNSLIHSEWGMVPELNQTPGSYS